MGCCEMRDKSKKDESENKNKNKRKKSVEIYKEQNEKLVKAEEKNQVWESARVLGIPLKEEVKDKQALDIFEYLNELEHCTGWEVIKKEENLSIKKRLGSKYSSEFLTSRLEFSFEYIVPLDMLLNHLNTQELRPKWDKNFVEFENIESKGYHEFLLYSAFKVITYKTEYLEKKFLILHNNRVYIVVYSVNDDRKPEGSINRAFTFFSVMVIYEHNHKTAMIVYNQTDPKNFLAKMATNVAIPKLSDWADKLKKRISSVHKVE